MSAAASATNQNAWIKYMKQQLKKYPKMKLVDVVYGNDDPTVSTQVTQGLLQKHPEPEGDHLADDRGNRAPRRQCSTRRSTGARSS